MTPENAPPDVGSVLGLFVARPVAVTMAFLAALVFGWVSYQRLPLELMPDISYPTLTVRTSYEGAAPAEVEQQVARPVEEALATLDGLVRLESRSRAGGADVVLGFDWGADLSAAMQSVRENLQTVRLPEGADRPLILRYDPSQEPFLRLALGWDAPADDPEAGLIALRLLADDEVKRRLEALPGVAAVRVSGGLEREIAVEIREDWLAARQLTVTQVSSALAAANVNLAGGSILDGEVEYLVRTLAELPDLEAIRALRVRRADGTLVPLTDVATVRERPKERTVLSTLDGTEAVELEVYKEADANVVEVARRVKEAVLGTDLGFTQADVDAMEEGRARRALQAQLDASRGVSGALPDGARLVLLDDQAAFIELALANLRSAVLLGGLLAVAVLWLFLRNVRATVIIGLAIPVSVVVGFAPLFLAGVSLNLMSLGGLALGVGMLVDNAVVVLEAIQRHLDAGRARAEAAVAGAGEVAAAVFASTLTTVAVFAPIAFVEGVGGELFGDLSLSVVGSLLASLVVALVLVPTLAALTPTLEAPESSGGLTLRSVWTQVRDDLRELPRWVMARPVRALAVPWVLVRAATVAVIGTALALGGGATALGLRAGAWLARHVGGAVLAGADAAAAAFQSGYARVDGAYAGAIRAVLRQPLAVVATGAVLLALALSLAGGLGTELVPEVHQGRLIVRLALPVGTPLAETARIAAAAEGAVAGHPEIATIYATVGADDRADSSADEGEHTARLRVQLTPGGSLAAREEAVLTDLRARLGALPDHVTVRVERPSLFSFQAPLQVVITGDDLGDLERAGEQVAARLAAESRFTDVSTSLQPGHPEIRIAYDRVRLARLGLDPRTVAETVRDRVLGKAATTLETTGERVDLKVQLAAAWRESLDDLRRLNINPNVVPPVPLEAVATLTEGVGPSEIRRVDQQRAVVVTAGLSGLDLGGATATVADVLADIGLPDGMVGSLGGQAAELGDALFAMALALALALFLVYVIMASTFEHLLHPLVILFSVPLAAVGVVAALALWGLPLGIVAAIGVIVLAGVVVNNAIVLVDAINQLRAEGLPRDRAVAEAAATRLRPILITTLTTVLGLLPLAFGVGAGAEVQQPLAVTLIGGLSTSTLLTLGVIPAVYALVTRDVAAARAPAPDAAEVG